MKTQNSRETILRCALQLFSQQGYEGISVSQVAQAAAITKPTLYYFFGSKEGLFRAVLQRYSDLLHTMLQQACGVAIATKPTPQHVWEVLGAIAQVYVDFAQAQPQFFRLWVALPFAPPASQSAQLGLQYCSAQYQMVQQVFEGLAPALPHITGQEKLASWQFIALVNAQLAFLYQQQQAPSPGYADVMVQQFLGGMALSTSCKMLR